MASSAQQKSIPQLIIWVNHEFMPSGDAGCSFDFWNDGVVRAESGRLRYSSGESGTDDAFNHDRFAGADLAARVMDGQPPADAGARRRAINLAFGEDTD